MLKFKLFILGLLCLGQISKADVDISFTGIHEPTEIGGGVQCKGDVTIIENGNNNMLRMSTSNSSSTSNFFFPTKLKSSKNFISTFDYKADRYGIAGMIFRIGDWNQNKVFYEITAEGNRFTVSTYNGKRYKRKPLCKIEKGIWYNFKVSVKGKNFSIIVCQRGQNNDPSNETVIYDSKRQRSMFRINPKVRPHIGSMAQWPGQGRNLTFYYDNITVASAK